MNDNQTFIITGTSRGFGKALAEYYLNRSINIIGISRGAASISNPNYSHYSLDISDENKVKDFYRSIKKNNNTNNICCLINNAAISYANRVLLTTSKEIESIFNINFIGNFLMTKEMIKLIKKNSFVRIISISSILSKKNLLGTSMYSSSKSALEKLIYIIREEHKETNISFDIIRLSAIENIGMSDEISEYARDSIVALSKSKKPLTIGKIVSQLDKIIFSKSININMDIE